MDTITQWLPLFGLILVIVSTLAFIYAYYTMNLSKAQIAALRGDRDDQAVRINRLEKELEEQKKLRDVDLIEKQELRTQVYTLQGLVTHDTKINELIAIVTQHDTKVEERYNQYMESNQQILQRIDRLLSLREEDVASRRSPSG